MAKTAIPTRIPNVGAMSEFIGAFDVPSKVTDYVYHCRFSHCWNGIATRHSDTMDCKFVVDGKGVDAGPGASGIRQIPRNAPAAIYRTARPATSAPNIFAGGSSRKTNTRSTTFPPRTCCGQSKNSVSTNDSISCFALTNPFFQVGRRQRAYQPCSCRPSSSTWRVHALRMFERSK